MNAFVSRQLDSYVNVYGDTNPMWIVELSNGETVYQDDGRPGITPPSAWERLKIYCDANDLHITKMSFKNRSHLETVGEGDDGYFFCKAAGAFLFGDETVHSFVVGRLSEGKLYARKWRMPEVIPEAIEERNISESLEYLITKNGVLNEQGLQTQDNGTGV
tara:strand:- start:3312 stop:3794 length:483 start_codon:yes stop_codon:yes gene_type:complete